MDGGEEQTVSGWKHQVVEDGEWAGWTLYGSDPFEDHAGPFYFKIEENGRPVCAMRAEKHHMNGGGFMHGGAIMTFADYCLFVIARDALADSRSVTATFNSEFVGAVPEGSLLECRGEVVKAVYPDLEPATRSGTGDEPVMNFSAVIKKTRPRDAA